MNGTSSQTALVIASHPDDEVLGCGGVMARLAEEGTDVHIVVLGEGITSRQSQRRPEEAERDLKQLHEEVAVAARLVGAKSSSVLSFPDNRFDTVPLLDVVKAIEEIRMRLRPDTIFTHCGTDLNVDHRITFQAVVTACRPQAGLDVSTIYSFEVPSSTEWQAQLAGNSFTPTAFFRLEERHVQAKISAMESYSSERRTWPHPRSPRAIRALAEWRGANIGADFGEAFQMVRSIL